MSQSPQSRRCVYGHEEAAERPMQQLSPAPYCPKSEGIKVIQQYVSTIVEEASPGESCAREGDIWDYDLIGAVGIKASAKKSRATVVYHVKWKGFPIREMTWEPESHLPRGDLEILWSIYGRVNTAGKVVKFHGEDRSSRPAQSAVPKTDPVEPYPILLPNTASATALLGRPDLPWL